MLVTDLPVLRTLGARACHDGSWIACGERRFMLSLLARSGLGSHSLAHVGNDKAARRSGKFLGAGSGGDSSAIARKPANALRGLATAGSDLAMPQGV